MDQSQEREEDRAGVQFFLLQGRSSNLVSALRCGACFVDCVIVALKAKQNHFVVYAESLFEGLTNFDDRLLRLRLTQPHRDLVSPISHVDDGAVDKDALAIERLSYQAEHHF